MAKKIRDWLKATEAPDYSNRKCSNCSFGQSGDCDMDLKEECVTATGDETHKDWWADANEDEEE